MPDTYTCITCQVLFKSPELQREHYKLDWHRYNLKRKVASIPPITLEEFQLRAQEHKEQADPSKADKSQFCTYCAKVFNTKNAFENHLNSKKHKLAHEKHVLRETKEEEHSGHSDTDSFVKVDEPSGAKLPKAGKFVVVNADDSDEEDIETDSDIEELDSDEWEDCSVESNVVLKAQDCLFCEHHSRTIIKNLKHMCEAHSFFIPDVEYCVNVRGLLLHLGEKISQGFMCIWCNDTGKTFFSLEAVRSHMTDKGHCKMLHDSYVLAEYADYYDFSPAYPECEANDNMDIDDEIELPGPNEGEDYEMVLPSGKVVGHRTLVRYYKQSLVYSKAVLVKKSDRKLHKLFTVYRALGWSPNEELTAAKKARDIRFMKRVNAKWQLKMSMKNNKFQKHFRQQVNY